MTLFSAPQTQLTSDDCYTPAWIFEAMGLRFDVDVSSPPSGVPWIPCDQFFTMAEDGLAQPWVGRVWMNPPYSNATPWAHKFMAHRNGVALLPWAKSRWCDEVWDAADAIVSLGTRTDGFVGKSPWLSCFLAAYGAECVEAIGRVGTVRLTA